MNKYMKKRKEKKESKLASSATAHEKIDGKLAFQYEPHRSLSASVYAELILTGATRAPGGVNKSLGLWDAGLERCISPPPIWAFPMLPTGWW